MPQSIVTTKASASQRSTSIKRILWIVLLLNVAVAIAKYIYGTISGSTSMQADGIHSIIDSAGNVVGLVGIAVAARPADESHPYGHAKFETYASLVIGIMLFFAAFEVGTSAVGKLVSQTFETQVTPLSFVVMVLTLCINIGVTLYEHNRAKALKSEVLKADASHTLSDALVSVGVIVGLVLVSLGFPIADPIMALVVMVAIITTAVDVFKRGLATLSDRARIPEEEIHRLVMDIPGVHDAHKIRTRGSEGEVYADLHVLVDPSLTVRAAHRLSDTVEELIEKSYPQVVEVLVHIEPNDDIDE